MAYNMSYCKFQNTKGALQECLENFEEANSEEEHNARRKLIDICKDIARDYGENEEMLGEYVEEDDD